MLDAVLALYEEVDLLERAAQAARQRASAEWDRLLTELEAVEAEIRTGDDAVECYLPAFEAGTLPEATCSKRFDAIADRAVELRARRVDLSSALEDEPRAPSEAQVAKVRKLILKAISEGACRAQDADERTGPRGHGDEPRRRGAGVPLPVTVAG